MKSKKAETRGGGALQPECSAGAWVKTSERPPPKGETVLMWYPGTKLVGPWCKTDRIGNIVLQPPKYWAHIFPPNTEISDAGNKP